MKSHFTTEDTKLTETILHMISRKISSRTEYKNIEFLVTISEGSIVISPAFLVFPNKQTRKASDKMSLNTYILRFLDDKDISSMVPGLYIFSTHNTSKKRFWLKA